MNGRGPDALVERDGHVLIVTMNRPEARNAFSSEMLGIMSEAWDEVNADPDIRVAILTGAGGAFCAGADLKAMTRSHPGDSFAASRDDAAGSGNGDAGGDGDAGGGDGDRAPAPLSEIKPLLKGFLLEKPLIAAVEGPAIAGGTEILQATDIRVAGESARFGVSEVRWGLFPLGGSAVRLRRQIPYTVAADILLTGRQVMAPEAKELGLISHVVPDGTALDTAREIAATIASNGPIAVQAVLRVLRETECLPERDAFQIESKIGIEVFTSDDAKEGPRAFTEKRSPVFGGR